MTTRDARESSRNQNESSKIQLFFSVFDKNNNNHKGTLPIGYMGNFSDSGTAFHYLSSELPCFRDNTQQVV